MLMMSGGVLVFFSVAVTVAIAVTVGAILASITDSIAVAVLPGIDIQSVEHHVRILDRLCRVLEQIVDLIEELEVGVVCPDDEQGGIHTGIDEHRVCHREIRSRVYNHIVVEFAKSADDLILQAL